MNEDPNKDRNDPMVPEYWQLGEDLQDHIRRLGYDSPTVEGIAVDVHDLLQAAARIEQVLIPEVLGMYDTSERVKLLEKLTELRHEFAHIGWHCSAAVQYLTAAINELGTAPAEISEHS